MIISDINRRMSRNILNNSDINKNITDNNIEFLVDKYIPNNIDDIFEPDNEKKRGLEKQYESDLWEENIDPQKCFFHKGIFRKLKKISEDDGMPHIIFYGNPGSGKKTLINLFLEMIFDKSIYKLDNSKYVVVSSGNIENEVIVKQSDNHIIIEPNNNNFDRYLIQDIVKEYAKRYPLSIFEKNRNFKAVQINNLDNLSYYAQTSLRRTMEIYSKSCRFIMWCYSLSKVIEPVRSRCLCIHVPTQNDDTLIKWIFNIACLENINLNAEILNKILVSSNGNLKKILWKLDLYKYQGRTDNAYQISINKLIKEIITNGSIQKIRDYVYNMMITNITSNTIIKDILNTILLSNNNISNIKKMEIINCASEYEYRLSKSRRDIIHIEAFIDKITKILNQK
jgi:replication factor C subunit 3/5